MICVKSKLFIKLLIFVHRSRNGNFKGKCSPVLKPGIKTFSAKFLYDKIESLTFFKNMFNSFELYK
jgi:hypothetical protein